jgi:hypothetical protein
LILFDLAYVAAHIVPETSAGIWLSTRIFWKAMAGIGGVVRLGRKLREK